MKFSTLQLKWLDNRVVWKGKIFNKGDVVTVVYGSHDKRYEVIGRIRNLLLNGLEIDFSEHFLSQVDYIAYENIIDVSEFEEPV